jgi:integrase
MTLSFNTRAKTLYFRINSGVRGCSKRFSTGIKTTGCMFDPDRQRFIDRSEHAIRMNAKIKDITNRFEELVKSGASYDEATVKMLEPKNEEPDNSKLMLVDFMASKFSDIERGERSKRKTPFAEESVLSYRSAFRFYKKFVDDVGNDINLYDVDLYSKKTREERVAAANKVHDVMFELLDWMIQLGLKPNTQKHYINMTNRYIKMAEQEHMISVPKESPPPGEEFPIVTLPMDFMAGFVSDSFGMYEQIPHKFKWLYEASLIILNTTFRIKDVMSLKHSDFVVKPDGNIGVRHIASKRKKSVTVPIPRYIYDMVTANYKEYGNIYTYSDELKPIQTNYQDYVQELFAMYEPLHIEHSVQRMTPDQRGVVTETRPYYKFITAHALRRTAITAMLISGVPEMQVKIASGHTHDSAAFKKYVDYVEATFNTEITSFQEKLFGANLYGLREKNSFELAL